MTGKASRSKNHHNTSLDSIGHGCAAACLAYGLVPLYGFGRRGSSTRKTRRHPRTPATQDLLVHAGPLGQAASIGSTFSPLDQRGSRSTKEEKNVFQLGDVFLNGFHLGEVFFPACHELRGLRYSLKLLTQTLRVA